MSRTDRQPRRRLDPDQRREQILAAAAHTFADRRYAEVTVAEVASAAQASEALVYRYFPGKAELYAALVARAVDDLLDRQGEALAALPDGVPARDRLRTAALVYLDHVAAHPVGWSAPLRGDGGEPPVAVEVRRAARTDYVERLRAQLSDRADLRHDYAIWGFFGFLDAACLRWVDQGCPPDHRWSVLDAALGALEGALGDWDA
ncbi:MAG: TetR/AcrR family transcriptional regulator [Cellulomonas sp.]|nr:TetR/AcrR family transcriptional regulator [Cellulomonas sp.]